MICNIQDTLQIDLPDKHKDVVTAYNTEWDKTNGQGWELKNFIELTKDRKSLYDAWYFYILRMGLVNCFTSIR